LEFNTTRTLDDLDEEVPDDQSATELNWKLLVGGNRDGEGSPVVRSGGQEGERFSRGAPKADELSYSGR